MNNLYIYLMFSSGVLVILVLAELKDSIPDKKIFILIKSEWNHGDPEWKYLKHSTNLKRMEKEAEDLYKSMEDDKVSYIVIPLTVKETPLINMSRLLRKEYDRRLRLIVKKKLPISLLF